MIPLNSNPTIMAVIADISFGLEVLAVLIILLAIFIAACQVMRGLINHQQPEIYIIDFKHAVGRGVQLALELLIAADIINTVVLDATLSNVLVLGILVIIRTFLSWTLILESEGHLPWWKNPKQKK